MRKILLSTSIVALVLIIPLGIMSLAPSKFSIFSTGATPTPDLFDPAHYAQYGVPETIAGHKVLAVISAENTACVPPNDLILIVRVGAPDQQSYLNSGEALDLNAAMKEFDHPGMDWALRTIGPGASLENLEAATNEWNELMKNGCLVFHPVGLVETATPVSQQGSR